MRGIHEIQEVNENPHRHEIAGATITGGSDFDPRNPDHLRKLAEQSQARTRVWDGTASHARVQNAEGGRPKTAAEQMPHYADYVRDVSTPGSAWFGRAPSYREWDAAKKPVNFDDLFFTALLLDIVTAADRNGRRQPEHQERIHSAIDVKHETPFFKFWRRLNERLVSAGYPETDYGTARTAFNGGKTPLGSMTFVGKEWDGLRAVPAEPVQSLGGARPHYHAEHREETGNGIVWHKVTYNDSDKPIVYGCPEAALVAAKAAKAAAIAKAFH